MLHDDSSRELLAALAQSLNPSFVHRKEVGRIAVCFVASYKVEWWIAEPIIPLAEVRDHKTRDRTCLLKIKEAFHCCILCSIVNSVKGGFHTRKEEQA